MKGILYGVGVGPGDPELLTLKALGVIKLCRYIAVPDSGARQTALEICRSYIEGKELLHCPTPMTKDADALERNYEAVTQRLCDILDTGESVAFLTIGDPSIYSTYMYIHAMVAVRGYEARMIPGVPSFCCGAALLGRSLCEKDQALHIIPAGYHDLDESLALSGTKVFMKSGKGLATLLDALRTKNLLGRASLVERCGLEGQRVIHDLSDCTDADEHSYFTLVIVTEDL